MKHSIILELLLFACGIAIGWILHYDKVNNIDHKHGQGWYYLSIPDSPHVAHPTLELDYTADDTAYLNWYWTDDSVKCIYPWYHKSYSTTNPSPLYETDGVRYYNGQILYPDYVHTDTLIVVDSDFINKYMSGPDVASDADIYEILQQGTEHVLSIKEPILK